MHPHVLLHRQSVLGAFGNPVPRSSIQGLPGYEEACSVGFSGVTAVTLRHRNRYQWVTLTRRHCCTRPEIYRQSEFVALEDPPACHATFMLHKRDLVGDIVGCARFDDPEVQAMVCDAVRQFAREALRSWWESALLELELETTTVLSYDWLRWWWPVPCVLPKSSSAAEDQYRIGELEMEVYTVDEECGVEACPICLEDFVPGSEVERLPCRHRFHGECLVRWLEGKGSCPICRSEFQIK